MFFVIVINMTDAEKPNILITGGAGYIGSHVVRALGQAGFNCVVVDDLSTGQKQNLTTNPIFIKGDFADKKVLQKIFSAYDIDAVVHLAAKIDLNESIEKPLDYFETNTIKTGQLLKEMIEAGVKKIVFASTAAIYGVQKSNPIPETAIGENLAPYGQSKLLAEKVLESYAQATDLRAVVFRFFNASGSDFDKKIYSTHESGLFSSIANVLKGKSDHLTVYGTDFDTIDGSGVRDYVHVLDIANAIVRALQYFQETAEGQFKLYNIGTATGWSVKQVIAATEKYIGKELPVKFTARRSADVAIAVADNTKIKQELGFEPKHSDLKTIIQTSWH